MIERILTVYIVQVLLALIIGFLFSYYSKQYEKKFLSRWAASWYFYAIVYVGLVVSSIITSGPFHIFTLWVVLAGSYLQLFFLILGLIEFINRTTFKQHWMWIVSIIVFSLVCYIAFHNREVEIYSRYRYALRVGLKSLITGVGFLYLTYKIFISTQFHQGLGKRFLEVAFLIYALQQLWHSSIVFRNVLGFETPFPYSTYGLIDLFTLSLIGLAMVQWLLENEQKQLEKTNRELDSFLYSTSHDLRAPVASVLGLTHLAKEDVKDEMARKYFQMIEERLQKLDLTIDDILMLSKGANVSLNIQEIAINPLLDHIIEETEFLKQNQNIRFIRQLDLQHIKSDPLQLENILNNLISNAVKYHDIEKNELFVKITLQEQDKYYVITVEDNGQGIAENYQEKIFDMFYRANDKSDGTGLGLYITKEAVLRLDGKISLETEEGKGSVFTVALPKN